MSDIAINLSPSGALTITERWKSGGRPQQVEIILQGSDLERLRAVLGQDAPMTKGASKPVMNAVNWPAIAAYLLGSA